MADKTRRTVDLSAIQSNLDWELATSSIDAPMPDELVEGWIERGTLSVWFGQPNVGKTFCLIDLGAAVSRGISWMGRRTHKGLVVYLASEAPSSVKRRLKAYQRHHQAALPDFILVKNPINLFASDADAKEVISLIRQIEKALGRKCELVIGETLACMALGAKENSDDMGIVFRHVECIAYGAKTHVAIIAHSGKDGTKGTRGWSGIKAKVDTEVEVQSSKSGNVLIVTKQRDLSKSRIGFSLLPVEIGVNKWGNPVTSCIVELASDTVASSRPSLPAKGLAADIAALLKASGIAMAKADIVKQLLGKHYKANIYRELKQLQTQGLIMKTPDGLRLPDPAVPDIGGI